MVDTKVDTNKEDLDISTINRSEIHRVTGIDMAHISRIFSGKARPSLGLARRIADHLGVTVEVLCDALDLLNAQGAASDK
jgi:transcriptional regulator with XRE-family HTH domain